MTQPDSFETWRKGFGPIVHSDETIERVRALAATTGVGAETLYRILIAADRLAGAAMWTVVHMRYAERVHLSGAPLTAAAFKTTPEGHTGRSHTMFPAFVGYLAATALRARTPAPRRRRRDARQDSDRRRPACRRGDVDGRSHELCRTRRPLRRAPPSRCVQDHAGRPYGRVAQHGSGVRRISRR